MAAHYAASNITSALSTRPNDAACVQIWEKFFCSSTTPAQLNTATEYEKLFAGYFQHLYWKEIEKLMRDYNPKNRELTKLAIKTHEDILNIVDILHKNKQEPKSIIISKVGAGFAHTKEKQIRDSIDLAVRVRFMINARDPPKEGAQDRVEPLDWKPNQTLQQFLRSSFPYATWKPQGKDSRLKPLFSAAYMVKVCGLELQETSCLRDHLQLCRSEKKNVLRYFPYKSCLHLLNSSAADPIIPRQVIKETIKSLDLLFPINDVPTDKLLKKRGQTFHEDARFSTHRTLNVLEFKVWRDRLLELHEEVFLSPPASWAQLYRDRRNPQQFWTFWIALVILVLTIVATFAGVAQTVYTVLGYYKS